MRASILSTIAAGLLLALGSTTASAQVCLAFSGFCDGLELTVSGNNVSGLWKNTDCAGTDVSIMGRKGSFVNACGAPTNAVGCHPNDYPAGCVGGSNWWFNIDLPVDNSMDLSNGNYPAGSCWIDELGYALSFGPCALSAEDGGQRVKPATTD